MPVRRSRTPWPRSTDTTRCCWPARSGTSAAPMIMSTFTEGHDFTGKTVLPVVTYAVSGLGSAVRDSTAACRGARIGDGPAVRGEEVTRQRSQVSTWLRDAGLTTH